jgi:hypothetical protein
MNLRKKMLKIFSFENFKKLNKVNILIMNKIISDYFLNDSTLKLFYTVRNSANITPITIISATENIINEIIPLPIKTSRVVHPIFITCFIALKVLIGYIMYKNIQKENQPPPSLKERSKEFFKKYGPVFLALSTLGAMSYFTYRQFLTETIDKVAQSNIPIDPVQSSTSEHVFQDLTNIAKNSKKTFSVNTPPSNKPFLKGLVHAITNPLPNKTTEIQPSITEIIASTPATTNPFLNKTSVELPSNIDENPLPNKTTEIQPSITETTTSTPAITDPLINETSVEIPLITDENPLFNETTEQHNTSNDSLAADIAYKTDNITSNASHIDEKSLLNDTVEVKLNITKIANKSNEENLNTTDIIIEKVSTKEKITTDILKPDPDINQKPPKTDTVSIEQNTQNSKALAVIEKVTQTNTQETIKTIGSIFNLFNLASIALTISSIFTATAICNRKKTQLKSLIPEHTFSRSQQSLNRSLLNTEPPSTDVAHNPVDYNAPGINNPSSSPQDNQTSQRAQELSLRAAALEENDRTRNGVIQKLEEALSSLKEDLESLSLELESAKKNADHYKKLADHYKQQLSDVPPNIQAAIEKFEKNSAELKRINSEKVILEKTIKDLVELQESDKQKIKKLETENLDIQDSQRDKIEKALESPTREITRLKRENESLQNDIETLLANVRLLTTKIKDLSEEIGKLRTQSLKLEQHRTSQDPDKPTYEQLESTNRAQAEKIRRLEQLESTNRAQAEKIRRLEKLVKNNSKSHRNGPSISFSTSLEQEIDGLKQEIGDLKCENKSLREALLQYLTPDNLVSKLNSYYSDQTSSHSAYSRDDEEVHDLAMNKRRLKNENKYLESLLAEYGVPDDSIPADNSHNDGTSDDDDPPKSTQSGRFPTRSSHKIPTLKKRSQSASFLPSARVSSQPKLRNLYNDSGSYSDSYSDSDS